VSNQRQITVFGMVSFLSFGVPSEVERPGPA
jgi:hypothetical protein